MANKKTSDYLGLPAGTIDDAWLYDIGVAGVTNYKATGLEVRVEVQKGITGGKTIEGGTAASEDLLLDSTNDATKGDVQISDGSTLHSNTTNYEVLVTDDDDIPNKKYVDDIVGASGLVIKDLTTQLGAGGVTAFTLDSTPASAMKSLLFYNGARQIYGINYTIAGTALTWIITPPSFALSSDDGTNSFWIYYDITVSPLHPPTAFKAQVNSDHIAATGDGTAFTILFQHTLYDEQADYNPATGQYTAAFDQIFNAGFTVLIDGTINITHEISLTLTHRNSGGSVLATTTLLYEIPFAILSASPVPLIISGGSEFKLSAGDTVEAVITGSGSTKTIDVINTTTEFYGHVAAAL